MGEKDDSQYRTIEQIMQAREKSAQSAAKEVDIEESKEQHKSKDQLKSEIKGDIINTNRNKHKFISEIKMGLGENIKNKPMEVKSTLKEKTLMDRIKSFFTKF